MVLAESAVCQALSSPSSFYLLILSSIFSNLFLYPCPKRKEIVKFGVEPSSKETSASSVPPPHPMTERETWGMGVKDVWERGHWPNLPELQVIVEKGCQEEL